MVARLWRDHDCLSWSSVPEFIELTLRFSLFVTFPEILCLSLKYCNGWGKVQAGQLSSSEPCRGLNAQCSCSPGSSPSQALLAGQIHLLLTALWGRTVLPRTRGEGEVPSLLDHPCCHCMFMSELHTALPLYPFSLHFSSETPENVGCSWSGVALPNHRHSLSF